MPPADADLRSLRLSRSFALPLIPPVIETRILKPFRTQQGGHEVDEEEQQHEYTETKHGGLL